MLEKKKIFTCQMVITVELTVWGYDVVTNKFMHCNFSQAFDKESG